MSKLAKMIGGGVLVAIFVYWGHSTVLSYQRKAQREIRLHNIMAIGKAYVRNDGDVGTNTQMSLAELRLHLPSGFPLDRYELLPQHIPSDPSDLLIREVATDEDGLRAVIFADGHGTFVHK